MPAAIPTPTSAADCPRLLIVAGWGGLPRLIIEGAREAGVGGVDVIGVKGSTCCATYRAADKRWKIAFGDLDAFRGYIKESGAKSVVLAGQINPLLLFNPRAAAFIFRELGKGGAKTANAHTIFQRLSDIIEECGASVLPSSLFLRRHIPQAGVLGARQPTERENADLAYGAQIASAIAELDIGQTIVAKNGAVLAVEGLDGTNATLARGGRIGRGGAVAVKAAKAAHDMRFDIPVIGLKTIALMRRRGISALGVQAGRTIILDIPEVVKAADKAGIALVAQSNTLPPAPIIAENLGRHNPAGGLA